MGPTSRVFHNNFHPPNFVTEVSLHLSQPIPPPESLSREGTDLEIMLGTTKKCAHEDKYRYRTYSGSVAL